MQYYYLYDETEIFMRWLIPVVLVTHLAWTGFSSSDDRSSLSSMDEDDTERLEIEMRVLERLCKQNSKEKLLS